MPVQYRHEYKSKNGWKQANNPMQQSHNCWDLKAFSGNFVTLSKLSDAEWELRIKKKISAFCVGETINPWSAPQWIRLTKRVLRKHNGMKKTKIKLQGFMLGEENQSVS